MIKLKNLIISFNFSHVDLGRKGYQMGEDAGLRRIYRPDYRDPIELPEEPELNPADIEADLKRFFSLNLSSSISSFFMHH